MKRFFLSLSIVVFLFSLDVAAQRTRLISDIQGSKNVSDYQREWVSVTGIVTARARNGFYIQTPDNEVDKIPNRPEPNLNTSEGLFVFTRIEPTAEATVGNLVRVSGTVTEFSPRPDPNSLPVTQISMQTPGRDAVAVISRGNSLPAPIVLTAEDFKPNSVDQLEKYENMRVVIRELIVVAPTEGRADETTGRVSSNGIFYGVLKGLPRPFRGPGYSVYDFFLGMAPKDREKFTKDYPQIGKLFDHNPERLRIESSAQLGSSPINVSTNAELRNLTGVMSYSYRVYSILVDPDSPHTVSGGSRATPIPAAEEGEFTIASINLERLFDEADEANSYDPAVPTEVIESRFRKFSNAIRNFLRMPDVIGVSEVENIAILERLAKRINADAVAAGLDDPKYTAHLLEGNDPGGIDVGFLVKSSRVSVISVKQYAADERFRNPVTKVDQTLNDRPPLVLKASIQGPNEKSLNFTVVSNHKKSFLGYNDEKNAPAVRLKKQLQAETLARLVSEIQKENPNEPIALVGDFNHFLFSDGITDVINTIKGTPLPKTAVMFSSPDLVNPDLVNVIDLIKDEEKYSYTFEGNAQVLDHIVINQVFFKHLNGFRFGRLNADFPETLKGDVTRAERFSDHDVPVAYFRFDPQQ
jgi:predicted extracellular nuclease